MTIEYRIQFEKNGVTVTQRLDPSGGTISPARPGAWGRPVMAYALRGSYDEGLDAGAGGGPEGDAGPGGGPEGDAGPGGGGGAGMCRAIVFGPVVICGETVYEVDAGHGGGPEGESGPGGEFGENQED